MTPAGQLISADVHGSVIVWRSGKGRAGQSAQGVASKKLTCNWVIHSVAAAQRWPLQDQMMIPNSMLPDSTAG